MEKKILIVGGSGYIGTVTVNHFLKKNYKVVCIDNLLYGQNKSLKQFLSKKNFTFLKIDLRDILKIDKAIKNSQNILILAGLVGDPITKKYKKLSHSINYEGIKKLINRCKNIKNIKRLVFVSTCSNYGIGKKVLLNENSKLKPLSLYSKQKVKIEKFLIKMKKTHFTTTILRFATAFGLSPRMRLDLLVNDFCYRAFRDKYLVLFESHFKRNYIHIRDVSRVFIHCLNNFDLMKDNIFNVGLEDTNISKKELCIAIKKHIPSFDFFENNFTKDPDQRNYIVSNQKIIATGFKTKFSLDFGIQELLKGYVGLKNYKFGNI